MDDRQTAIENSTEYQLPDGEAFSWQDALNEVKAAVTSHQPVILYGPPGTGKTKLLYELKRSLTEEERLGKFEVVQFHRKFSYEDFIEGYSPSSSGGFERKDGIFKRFVQEPSGSPVDLFVIDEINRAEVTTTLGELMFLIEDRDERSVKTSHFSDELRVPGNLSLVGTMNTADRNIATLDFALRRRFKFIPLFPDYIVLRDWLHQRGFEFNAFDVNAFVSAARTINTRIANNRLMGRNMQLGHAMWVPKGFNPINDKMIADLFQFEIIPQLESYLGFGNEGMLAELLNTTVAGQYLGQKNLRFDSVAALVLNLANENEQRQA